MRFKRLSATVLSCICIHTTAQADIAGDLTDFWDDLGGTSNRTAGTSFAGQSAGYYTAGNIRVRGPARNSSVFNFSPPSFAGGCGGIDLFAGSLSYINQDELVQLSRAIAANAVGYAFDLALETLSPVIAETMKDLRARLQSLNLQNINSCETAQGLVDSVVGKESQARYKLCQRIGTINGLYTDYSDARSDCSTPASEDRAKATLNPDDFEGVIDNVNLTWHFMRGERIPNGDWLKQDDELAEFAMTLAGTIIINNNGEKTYHAPKALDEETLATLFNGSISATTTTLTGGTVTVTSDLQKLECIAPAGSGINAHENCLFVRETTLVLAVAQSFRGRVNATFEELIDNIQDNTAPSDENVSIINGTSIPIWKALNVFSAYSGPILETQLDPLIDIVASDLMLTWIQSLITEVNFRATSSQLTGFEGVEDWKDDLRQVQSLIIDRRIDNNQKIDRVEDLVQRLQLIEEILSSKLGSTAGDTIFATSSGGTDG
jgi:conjugative transfer pilus assembly protein TraH